MCFWNIKSILLIHRNKDILIHVIELLILLLYSLRKKKNQPNKPSHETPGNHHQPYKNSLYFSYNSKKTPQMLHIHIQFTFAIPDTLVLLLELILDQENSFMSNLLFQAQVWLRTSIFLIKDCSEKLVPVISNFIHVYEFLQIQWNSEKSFYILNTP